jgi:hypothetical protein
MKLKSTRNFLFLDCLLHRQPNGSVTTTVYRKPSNTNIVICPTSCQHPSSLTSSFKNDLCRTHRVCSSTELRKRDIDSLLDMYEDNASLMSRVRIIGLVSTKWPWSMNLLQEKKSMGQTPLLNANFAALLPALKESVSSSSCSNGCNNSNNSNNKDSNSDKRQNQGR